MGQPGPLSSVLITVRESSAITGENSDVTLVVRSVAAAERKCVLGSVPAKVTEKLASPLPLVAQLTGNFDEVSA